MSWNRTVLHWIPPPPILPLTLSNSKCWPKGNLSQSYCYYIIYYNYFHHSRRKGERKRHQIIIIMHSAPNSVQNKIYLWYPTPFFKIMTYFGTHLAHSVCITRIKRKGVVFGRLLGCYYRCSRERLSELSYAFTIVFHK